LRRRVVRADPPALAAVVVGPLEEIDDETDLIDALSCGFFQEPRIRSGEPSGGLVERRSREFQTCELLFEAEMSVQRASPRSSGISRVIASPSNDGNARDSTARPTQTPSSDVANASSVKDVFST